MKCSYYFGCVGARIPPAAQGEVEAYLSDANTLKGMQRVAIMGSLDDTFNLELYTDEIFQIQGQWALFKATNSFEFIGGTTDMTQLTVIPFVSADDDNLPGPKLMTADIGTYPIPMPVSEIGGFILDSLQITKEKAVPILFKELDQQILIKLRRLAISPEPSALMKTKQSPLN